MINYLNGKIYKLICDDGIYIGSTCRSLNCRLNEHKRHRHGNHKTTSSNLTINENTKIELLEEYPCNTKYDLEKREAEYMILNPHCINNNIPRQNYNPNRWGNRDTACSICNIQLKNGSLLRHNKRKHPV